MCNSDKKNLLATLCYFDAMDYPLTTFEAWRHLMDIGHSRSSVSFKNVVQLLEELRTVGWISCESGFWFLKGRALLAADRIERQKISLCKIKMAKKWASRIAWLPYLRSIIVTGTLAMKKATRGSDWDVLVVTRKDRIWTGRLVLTAALFLCGKWRHGKKTQDRFCLNHFLAENGLILQERNEFTAKEISFCLPLLGGKVYQRYQQLNEFWVQSIKPNYVKDLAQAPMLEVEGKIPAVKIRKFLEKIMDAFGISDWVNMYIKRVMIRRIERNPLTYQEGADIRYNDQAMVFLPIPQRQKLIQKALLRLTEIAQ